MPIPSFYPPEKTLDDRDLRLLSGDDTTPVEESGLGPAGTTGNVNVASTPEKSASDSVRAYIESARAAQHAADAGQPKTDLERAQQWANFQHGLREFGRQASAPGRSITSLAAGLAGLHDVDLGGFKASDQEPDDSDNVVKQYIQRKTQAAQEAKAALDARKTGAEIDKDVASAESLRARSKALGDPSSLAAQKLALAQSEHDRKQNQGDETLGLRKGHEGFWQWLSKQKLTESDQKAALQAQRTGTMNDRLSFMQAKYNNTLAGNVTPGIEYEHPESVAPKNRDANASALAAADQMGDIVAEIKGLKDEAGYESLPLSEKRARLVQLRADLLPKITQSGGMGNFTVGHQHLADLMVNNPDSFIQMLNTGALDAQLDEMVQRAHENVSRQVQHTPGGGGKLAKSGAKPQKAGQYNNATHTISTPVAPVTKSVNGKKYEKRADGWYEVSGE